MNNKIIAGFLAALMTSVTAISPALATMLGDYPTFLAAKVGSTSTLDAYVVVGKDAASADVVGAVDLAARLSELSYTEKTVSGGTTASGAGIVRDGISIGVSSGGTSLATAVTGQTAFPTGVVLKNTHYTGLKDSTFSWRSSNYDYSEQVDAANVKMRHEMDASNINGSVKMVVGTGGDIRYEYQFDKDVSGTGSPSSPNYTYPIDIMLLGKKFTIVGADADSVLMLSGSVCNGATATLPCAYADYKVYAKSGGTTFVSLDITDKDGNVKDTLLVTGWASGTSVTKTSSVTGLDVTVTAIAALQDGTVVGTDMVVGPTGTTTHDYDATADVDSTGSSNEAFPGASRWGIQYSPGTTSANGKIGTGSQIEVVYKPSETQYLVAGSCVKLPNDYAQLCYDGFNTADFATITISKIGPLTVYNSTDQSVASYLYGVELASDKAGVFKAAGNYYQKGYVLFNASNGTVGAVGGAGYDVLVGYWDSVKGKIYVNDSYRQRNGADALWGTIVHGNASVLQYGYARLDGNTSEVMFWNYSFNVNNGEKDYWFNFFIRNSTRATTNGRETDLGLPFRYVYAGDSVASTSINMSWQNATTFSKAAGILDTDLIRLGATASSAESTEVVTTTEASVDNAGSRSNEIVDDTGLILVNSASWGASDKVVIKVPSKALAAKVTFGGVDGTSITTGGETVHAINAIKTTVAVLDTELTDAMKAKNLVAVGGPGVNKVTAAAMGLTYPTYGSSGLLPFKEGEGYIAIFDKVTGYTGKIVVVAGWEAPQTRTATTVLQQYDTLLAGQTASAVKVTAATTSGITPVTTTTTSAATTTTTTA